MSIGTGLGKSPELFGHADYYAARGAGNTSRSILAYINQNFNKLSKGQTNQPGGGGLYDQIFASAERERQAEEAARQRASEIARQEQLQRQAEQAQAERLRQMEISARTQAANTARSGLQSAMQIRSQSKTQKTAGTQGFKRRKLQVNPTTYGAISPAAAAGNTPQTQLTGVINP